ncbi:MAG: RNA methyltransferase [Prevotella shahii]|jgi:trmH family RNA methyltransferase|uniref:TrmH family RNA methyltransferase n=1 Tax=Hoylesella shahii TaxID=228603 RepID=UPI001CB2E513|nr:RNA methyltransferase [Hoylesella shahii]MBF1568291.1 RNA methyltransferase [Hoylesella shahii]
MTISKAKIKYIRSLEAKKHRDAEGVFVAEGPKVVGDLLAIMPAKLLVATSQWQAPEHLAATTELINVSEDELQKISFLRAPQQVMAVFPKPNQQESGLDTLVATNELTLMLDGIQDPGNLGTIIRLADWFGIRHVVCSNDTADVFNPKVIQATMGSIARVKVTYTPLEPLLDTLPASLPVYGTLLDGTNIYQQDLSSNGIIVMGNEGKGLSPAVRQRVSHKLLIPRFVDTVQGAESLNVAIATAIVCAEFRRQGAQMR